MRIIPGFSWHVGPSAEAQLALKSGAHERISSLRRTVAERRALLQQHPDARKIAAVLLGSPPADFREWVKMRQRADIETKKVLGEEPPDEASETLCSGVPDAVDKALGEFARFTLPSRAEGFDEVRYEWAGEGPMRSLALRTN
eukprot:s2574_g8.t1